MTTMDYIALVIFLVLWVSYAYITTARSPFGRTSLNQAMADRRRRWIYNSLSRDLKMIDTQIMAGLQNGTAFFASTSIFAIGGCFALLGATDRVESVFRDMPFVYYGRTNRFRVEGYRADLSFRLCLLQVRLVVSAVQLLHHPLRWNADDA